MRYIFPVLLILPACVFPSEGLGTGSASTGASVETTTDGSGSTTLPEASTGGTGTTSTTGGTTEATSSSAGTSTTTTGGSTTSTTSTSTTGVDDTTSLCTTTEDPSSGTTVAESTGDAPSPAVFLGSFVGGEVSAECGQWGDFKAAINPDVVYQSVTLRGSRDAFGRTCTGAEADAICQAIRTSSTVTVACDAKTWKVNECGSIETVAADDWDCKCGAQVINYSIFPCIKNLPQWGGIDDHPCAGETQMIELRCGP